MAELNEQYLISVKGKSSKGNQLKWRMGETWYKADLNGYEGLSEYIVSHLLKKSGMNVNDFVLYQTEKIGYKYVEYNGCSSANFLSSKNILVTVNRISENTNGYTLTDYIENIPSAKERMKTIVSVVENCSGISGFGTYLANLMLIDAFFLNEDRHLHNIALIQNRCGEYCVSPVFDNGAALLSDMRMDYPLQGPLREMISSVKSKTFDDSFDAQLDAAESLYGIGLTFDFNDDDIVETVNSDPFYCDEVKDRVIRILISQREKYSCYFR